MLDVPRARVCLLRIVPALCAIACLAAGCDPEGPGAIGTVTIGKNVKRQGLNVLRVHAIVRPRSAFDSDAPKFPGENAEFLGNSIAIGAHQTSVEYAIGRGMGTTDHHRWRLFAWLERDDTPGGWDDGPTQPPHGAPYGEVDFTVDSCGVGYDGAYCGHTTGVDLTIDKIAP